MCVGQRELYTKFPIQLFIMTTTTLLPTVYKGEYSFYHIAEANKDRNMMQIASCVVGGIAALGCVYVILCIFAYSLDKYFQRYRLLLGLFFSNLVFSIACFLPYWCTEPPEYVAQTVNW